MTTHRLSVATVYVGLVAGILAMFVACGGSSAPVPSEVPRPEVRDEGLPSLTFQRPREALAESGPVTAALITFEATPEHVAVLYAVAGDGGFAPTPPVVTIVNDKGEIYDNLSNTVLGVPEGVLIGLLVTEPYRPGGPVLSLRLDMLTDESGQTVAASLELLVATNTDPNSLVDFVEGGRYGHDAGILLRDATVGVAGPPAPSLTHALVQRGGKAASVYGDIDSSGVAVALTEADFRDRIGGRKAQLPPGFPWPDDVPY